MKTFFGQTRFGRGPFGQPRARLAFSVSIGSGPFTTGTELTVVITPDPAPLVPTYQWTDDGGNITGATSASYTAAIGTDSVADASLIRAVATIDGVPYTSPAREIRYAAGTASAIADGQDWTVDDTAVNLDASASGANLTFTYGATGLPAGVSINSGTGAITGTPTGVSSGTATVTATDQYGRTYVDTFTWTSALRTQATGGTDLDLTFPEDIAISSTDLIANWTDNGNTLTFASVSPALPAGLSISSAGAMTGTPTTETADATYTLTMEDEYGRETSDTFTLEIVTSVNPTLTSVGLTSPGSGARQQLALSYSYPNDPAPDTLVLYAVTSSEETMPGADAAAQRANIIAGTGTGSVEEFSVDPLGTTTVDLIGTGLTAASESATWLHAFIAEKNNGGVSAIVSTNISALDLTPPAFFSAVPADNATDAAIDVSPAITFAENVFAGEGVFTLRNVTAGTDVETFDIETGTGSAGGTIGISGAVVTINPNADFANSTDYSIRWPAGALLDANGNPVAVNAGDTIYNFTTVPSVSSGITFLASRDVFSVDLFGITSQTSSAIAPTAGANRGAFLVLTSQVESTGSAPVISAEWGAGNAFDIAGEMIPAVGSNNMIIVVFMMREADLPAGAEAITVNSTQGIRKLVGNLIEYENVHQATSPGVLNTATGVAASAITLTGTMTSADGLFFGVSAWRSADATPVTVTAGAGSTTPVKRVDRSGAFDNTVVVADELPGATGSVSHDHTASDSGNRARVVLEIFPAA